MDDWTHKAYSFFCNKDCECFPCHPTAHPENFNCLFCWCPLYALGDRCGGAFTYTESGIKDCSRCMLPHKRENYGVVLARFQEVAKLAAKRSPT